jgi:hypothetical protein
MADDHTPLMHHNHCDECGSDYGTDDVTIHFPDLEGRYEAARRARGVGGVSQPDHMQPIGMSRNNIPVNLTQTEEDVLEMLHAVGQFF